LITDTDL